MAHSLIEGPYNRLLGCFSINKKWGLENIIAS
jgi:hypothetical protein